MPLNIINENTNYTASKCIKLKVLERGQMQCNARVRILTIQIADNALLWKPVCIIILSFLERNMAHNAKQ